MSRAIFIAGCVAGMALVPYLLLPAKPLVYDAPITILSNETVQRGPLSRLFTVDFWGFSPDAPATTRSYRPLVSLTYAVQARALDNAAWVFHLTDMLLHALTSGLVVLLLNALGAKRRWLFPAGALFALHPVQSEAVASATGRADILAAVGLLAALLLHLRAGRAARPWAWHVCTLVALAAALLCKEYAVMFPFILIAVDVARGTGHGKNRVMWGAGLGLLAAYLLLRWRLFGALGGVPSLNENDHPLFGQPWTIRWGTAATLLILALRLLLLPYPLNHHYRVGTLPVADGLLDSRALFGAALALVLVLAAGWRLRERDPLPFVAVAFILLPLLPSLNTVSLSGVLFAERFLYIPMAGLALLFAWALDRLFEERPARVARVGIAVLLLLCAGMTMRRVQAWDSEEALARASLAHYPDAYEVWQQLGVDLQKQGRQPEALEALVRATQLRPQAPRPWKHLGETLTALGKHAEAAAAWRRSLDRSPANIGVLWRGWGTAALRAGQLDAALEGLTRAHELMPWDPKSLFHLAGTQLRRRDPDAAVGALLAGEQARANDPESLDPLLGQALLRQAQARLLEGQPNEALSIARRAVRRGALPPAGLWLAGQVAARSGDPAQARTWFEQAIALDPTLRDRER